MKLILITSAAFLSGVLSSLCGVSIINNPSLYLAINIPICIFIVILANIIFTDE